MRGLLFMALVAHTMLGAGRGADIVRAIHEDGFDADQCYRVRDLRIFKDDLKIYLTDGHLIFSKPVAGRRFAAVFTADVEGGDGEVMLLPPTRAERAALAAYTNSPNLDEHFNAALFVFTGTDYEALMAQFPNSPANRKDPEVAAQMEQDWGPALRSLDESFQTRLILDLMGGAASRQGVFAGVFHNQKLGNFDVIFDPSNAEQIVAGRAGIRDGRHYFDTWTSFQARSFRQSPPPRREDVKLRDYRIEATLNPDLSLDCVTRVKVTPAADGVAAVPFEISPLMTVAPVTVDGVAAEVLQRESLQANLVPDGNDVFLVIPPAPLRMGREYEFEFHHSGKVIRDAGDRVYYVTARGNWYPTHGLQFTNYDLVFRHSSDLNLVAAGDVVEDRVEGDWRITRRRSTSAIRFAAFNLGKYAHTRVEKAGYQVDVFANRALEEALQPRPLPPMPSPQPMPARGRGMPTLPDLIPVPQAHDPLERLHAVAAEIASAMEFMVSKFGPPAMSHISVSPIPGAFGQGFPGLIYLSTLSYLKETGGSTAGSEARQLFYQELLEAHEVAHQWWGNRVATWSYRDEWLMEALANISALMYIEKRVGLHSADMLLDGYRDGLLRRDAGGRTMESVGPISFGRRLESSLRPDAFLTITYSKGTWIMQMLRRRLGDERFLALLADIQKRYDRRDFTTEEFRAQAAQALPPHSEDPKLESFFDTWVYGTGIPNLKLTYSVKGQAPALTLTGTVTQTGVDPGFNALVPVEIQVARGQTVTRWVRTADEPVSFRVSLKQPPLKVELDPHNAVLRRE